MGGGHFTSVAVAFVCLLVVVCIAEEGPSPVILVPGTGGSQLEAKIDKPSTVHFYCVKKSDWFHLWMEPQSFLPGLMDCWVDNVHLEYDAKDGFQNAAGVEVRPMKWGKAEGVEWSQKTLRVGYFRKMIESFLAAGYVRDVTLRSAPYDFRYGAHTNTKFADDLKLLVEEMYAVEGRRVTIIAHSMGGLMSTNALVRQEAAWKKKYIERLITLGTPFDGAPLCMHIMAKGYNYGVGALNGERFRPAQRTYESNFWMLPRPGTPTAAATKVITPKGEFRVDQMEDFFSSFGFDQGVEPLRVVRASSKDDGAAPGVDVICAHGSGIDTPSGWKFSDDKLEKEEIIQYAPGDGSVPITSATACQRWGHKDSGDSQVQPVVLKEYPNVGHSALVTDEKVIADLLDVVTGKSLSLV